LEGLATNDVGIFYGHLVNFMAIWSILWPFGIFYGHVVNFMAIWSILWPFGTFYGYLLYFAVIWYIFPVLVCSYNKNLATLEMLRTTAKKAFQLFWRLILGSSLQTTLNGGPFQKRRQTITYTHIETQTK
jgi:hypothetical protein